MEESRHRVGFGARSIGRHPVGSEEKEVVDFGSDEEPTEVEEEESSESVVENRGRIYPLRNRCPPRRFPEKEYVLLTNEGELESFKEVKRDTHNRE